MGADSHYSHIHPIYTIVGCPTKRCIVMTYIIQAFSARSDYSIPPYMDYLPE